MTNIKIDTMKQHGAFSWNELLTSNMAGAKTFYTHMFGWELEDINAGMPYTMARINKVDCAGMMAIPPENEGMPASWGAYITVNDIEASAKQVVDLGGKVLMGPSDIPNVGRFVVVADPQGATLSLITYLSEAE